MQQLKIAIALLVSLLGINFVSPVIAGGHSPSLSIGEVSAVIAEASTADEPSELTDGQSGDTDFPYMTNLKALATVGEIDPANGLALTGYPDGNAAWLADNDTVRVVYQSESYANYKAETYGWAMNSGVKFTGSHIHTIDYDRAKFAEYLSNSSKANTMFKASGKLFSDVYNMTGDLVVPKSQGGKWGNQTLADGTLVDFKPDYLLKEGDFFFQSFCGAWYEKAHRYGAGLGFEDDVWLTAEEWNIQDFFAEDSISTHDTLGLASIVVDIENEVAYSAPALGQSGYEKILPINPNHPDYVVMVMAGYNHGVEPAPLRIYVGKKGVDANGKALSSMAPARDQFLARNGLLYGKIYGLAVENTRYRSLGINNIDLEEKMLDAYLMDENAPNTFAGKFFPSSYQWKGWDKTVSVGETEIFLWGDKKEQPKGYTFFVGDSKTEHPAVDPDIRNTRYVQNMTQEGGILGVELPNLLNELRAANGDLPESISAEVVRTVGAYEGALVLDVADKGVQPGNKTAAKWGEDEQAKIVANDGLLWAKTADADLLILDEDSGNPQGERKYALVLDASNMELLNKGKGHFLAFAGGKNNPRAAAEIAAFPGAYSKTTSSEFSGSWNVSALVAKKANGSFYTIDELAGPGEQMINASIPTNESTFIGVVQHAGESGGAVAANKGDQGGQVFMFRLNLPSQDLFAQR